MFLRKLNISDAERMLEWMNNPTIRSNFRWGDDNQFSVEHAALFIHAAQVDGTSYHRAIADDEGRYMGTVSLKSIDTNNMNAEYAIALHPDAIGKGYATQATNEILRKAFFDYRLNRVYLNVLCENVRAIKFYKRFGFVYEGTFKSHVFLHQRFIDLEWYRILHSEYQLII